MKIITQTLNKQDRKYIRDHNDKLFPGMIFYNAVNGYDINETIDQFKKSGLKYNNLQFNNYGTLANFLTKVKIIYEEVNSGTDIFCLIEDDLKLKKNFMEFIDNKASLAYKYNMLRLGKWGEGYIITNKGGREILKFIYKNGIIHNIDNQLRENCGPELFIKDTPWILEKDTNCGDCNKTKKINLDLLL
jgi:GR25 family glycosyltransferase involved in LPS biosynthesis